MKAPGQLKGARTIRYGPWTELHIVPGCGIVPSDALILGPQTFILAKNDSMVRAGFGSCTFQRKFFNNLTPDEEIQRQTDFEAFADQNAKERESRSPNPWNSSGHRLPSSDRIHR